MKKLGLILAVTALLLTGFGAGASPSRAHAQDAGADAIDAVYPLSLTEAINNRNPDVVLQHFVDGGTVTFDNSAFSIPNETISAAQYAARQRPNNPEVPADLRLEVVDGSLQISATRATWTWRQTADFLRDLNVDYIEFNVVAQTEDRRFKSLTLAPTKESLAKLPYSPSSPPALPSQPGVPTPTEQQAVLVQIEPVDASGARGTANMSATGTDLGTFVSFQVTGLRPHTPAQVTLHAGSCASPSASFTALPELSADAEGKAMGTGTVLFRGVENVPLATLADGEHIIALSQSGRVVACGTIPNTQGAPADPVGMPVTGGPSGQMVLLTLVLLAVGLVLAGLRLTRARTSS
jgi:hypothetical protein